MSRGLLSLTFGFCFWAMGLVVRTLLFILLVAVSSVSQAADVFLRCKVVDPSEERFKVTAGGFIHVENWHLPSESVEMPGGQWSRWIDLSKWPLHKRLDRVGGRAEWPAMKLSIQRIGAGPAVRGCALEVQLADKPDQAAVVHSFTERSGSDTIAFLLPHPLREKKGEFETGSQMTARHLAWAREATGGQGRKLKRLDIITSVWGHYDPALARQAAKTLKLLGFNAIAGVPDEVLRQSGMRTYAATWHLMPDPEESAEAWKKGDGAQIARQLAEPEGRWRYENMAHYVIADEIQTLDFRKTDPKKLNRRFRDYLRSKGETDQSLGRAIEGVEYPAAAMHEKTLPRNADLPTRKIMYYAGKFGQWWSVRQLRQTNDLVHASFAGLARGMKTETLPSDHGFFNAWGPPHCGMGYRGLDFFEIGAQEAVDILSVEDWLGLNHMYGPNYTWTGQHAFGYLAAIMRSGIGERRVALRALVTPSDDGHLRLKAYSALGQGAKSFFFWTFGPTYIGTENYWSDLRSEYDGIAKFTRALEKAEDILADAKVARDPVAILYSVSHDLWHTDSPAHFVESRLTWTALRHLGLQPDFLREEDVEAGRLDNYQVVYVIGRCLTRKASAKIDEWLKTGKRTVYLACGAATRDEFREPYVPPFALTVLPADAAQMIVQETGHRYNERADLPTIKPMTRASIRFPANKTGTVPLAPTDDRDNLKARKGTVPVLFATRPLSLKVIGSRLDLKSAPQGPTTIATFEDGRAAGAYARYGQGLVFAYGFLPGLAYSPFKPGQATLDEVWPEDPRSAILYPLVLHAEVLGASRPICRLSEPVVEASLLTGEKGSAIVLVNHTYKPIARLKIELPSIHQFRTATSTEGVPVEAARTDRGTTLLLPLEWTDVVLLPRD